MRESGRVIYAHETHPPTDTQHQPQEAIAECEAALELDADFGNASNDLGLYVLHHRGDREGALRHFKRAQAAGRYSEVGYR